MIRRIWKQGNSHVITLSPDQLEHMNIGPDGYAEIHTTRNKKVVISAVATREDKSGKRLKPHYF